MRPARPNRRFNLALAIDMWVGPALCSALVVLRRIFRRSRDRTPARVERILLVKMWGLGSIVLASPLFREIERLHPNARIDFVTLKENEAILSLYPQVSRVFAPDLSGGIAGFLLQTFRILWRTRRERYDLLLDLEFFTRFTALFSALAGAQSSHGFSAKGSQRGRLHDVEVPFNVYHHVTANFLALLRGAPFDRDLSFERDGVVLPQLDVPEDARIRCEETLAADPAFDPTRPTVVVNPNAGDMALERRWPADRVAALVDTLVARDDVNVVVSGSPAEKPYVDSLVAACAQPDRIVNLAGRVDLLGFIALLGDAKVLVSNDSGPLHLGAAAGVSTVALFGPETPVLYAPLRSREGQHHEVHYRGLPCSPCMFVHNNKVVSCWFAQAQCMTGIAPRAVYADVSRLLGGAGDAAPRAASPLRLVDS